MQGAGTHADLCFEAPPAIELALNSCMISKPLLRVQALDYNAADVLYNVAPMRVNNNNQ